MSEDELIVLTRQLLKSISEGDWDSYAELCAEDMTCFEPEARGQLVEGLAFHRFYFELGGHMGSHNSTLVSPRVQHLGDDAGLVTYVRVVQSCSEGQAPESSAFEETRVWHRRNGSWKHTHFHRSPAGS